MVKLSFLLFFGIIGTIHCAKILAFFPFPARSHHNVFQPIIEGLADKGHQITFVTPLSLPTPHRNVKEISIPKSFPGLPLMNLLDLGKLTIPGISRQFKNMGIALGDTMYTSKPIQDLIHSDEKFDLILLETLFVQESAVALMHKFGALGVDIQPLGESSWLNEVSGLPDNPSYMMDFKTLFKDEMTYLERLQSTYATVATTLVNYYNLGEFQKQMDKYFNYTGWESRPHISKMVSDKALILVNSHHSTGYPFPRAPHVREIGGINIRESKPLPKELQTILDNAQNGAIYFSLGSNLNISHISNKDITDALVKVFGKLKQQILWKWDSDKFPKASPNVKFSRWFPQRDILAHKNIKLFITHGGYLSTNEAVYNGVPLVGIPFFADQPKNMKHVSTEGYGVLLDRDNMTEPGFTWAINEVLNNPKYKAESMRRSALFKDRPMTPKEEAVYWIEYVLRYGNVLQPRGAKLSFWILHQFDILGTVIAVVFILYKILTTLLKQCCPKNTKNETNKKKKKE